MRCENDGAEIVDSDDLNVVDLAPERRICYIFFPKYLVSGIRVCMGVRFRSVRRRCGVWLLQEERNVVSCHHQKGL